MFAPVLNHTILQLYILQQNIPGIDYKGSRHDQNRIQPGMQQLEVSLVPRGRYFSDHSKASGNNCLVSTDNKINLSYMHSSSSNPRNTDSDCHDNREALLISLSPSLHTVYSD